MKPREDDPKAKRNVQEDVEDSIYFDDIPSVFVVPILMSIGNVYK